MPVLVGKTKAGVDWYFYPDRHTLKDLQIMVERIQHFGGVPTSAALGMLGRAPKMVTVKLTPTQSDRLFTLLPEGFIDEEITLLTTRVKAPPDTLEMILDYLDDDTAIDYVLSGGDAQTDEEMAFAERQVKRSMKSLRQKIKSAVSLGQRKNPRNPSRSGYRIWTVGEMEDLPDGALLEREEDGYFFVRYSRHPGGGGFLGGHPDNPTMMGRITAWGPMRRLPASKLPEVLVEIADVSSDLVTVTVPTQTQAEAEKIGAYILTPAGTRALQDRIQRVGGKGTPDLTNWSYPGRGTIFIPLTAGTQRSPFH